MKLSCHEKKKVNKKELELPLADGFIQGFHKDSVYPRSCARGAVVIGGYLLIYQKMSVAHGPNLVLTNSFVLRKSCGAAELEVLGVESPPTLCVCQKVGRPREERMLTKRSLQP